MERAGDAVEMIASVAWDDERAHAIEDQVFRNVLAWTAETAPAPWSDVARTALRSRDLIFHRWCA